MKTIMMIPNSSAMTRLIFEILRRSVAKPVGPVLAASFFFFLLFLEATVHSFLFPLPVFLRPPAPGSKSFHSVQMIQKDYRPFGGIFPPPGRKHRPMPKAYLPGRRHRPMPKAMLHPEPEAYHTGRRLCSYRRPIETALSSDTLRSPYPADGSPFPPAFSPAPAAEYRTPQ